MSNRTYTDEQLVAAIACSHSWRGVLRELGLSATSAGSFRSVRRYADRIGVSSSHFTGQRRWSDTALDVAVRDAGSWAQVAVLLGLAPSGTTIDTLRAHAVRRNLDTEHLVVHHPEPTAPLIATTPSASHLRDAGTLFAATWFALRGVSVAWPLEPCRYDLVADVNGVLHRIQVKTTEGAGGDALVVVSNSRRHGRAVYAPGEIDHYFVIDGELTGYLIPYETVAGLGTLKLSHYAAFVVADRGDLLSAVSSPAPEPRSRSGFP